MRKCLLLFFFLVVGFSVSAKPKTWITLSPHLTEIVFSLGAQDGLLAVSDFSDYPEQAKTFTSIASHQGVNFEAIMRLKPDLILAWQGGNKPQDLARLESLGFKLYYSNPQTLKDIGREVLEIGELTNQSEQAAAIADAFNDALNSISKRHEPAEPINVFYYMWPNPLMTVGNGAWANQLLETCGAENVFKTSPVAYPEVTKEQVIKRKPDVLVAAMKVSEEDAKGYWKSLEPLITDKLITVNPDLLHRFTPRLLPELDKMCQKLNAFADI